MAEIVPIINGNKVLESGSFVIPANADGGLDFGNQRLYFRYETNDEESHKIDIHLDGTDIIVRLINVPDEGAAFDVGGWKVNNEKVSLSVCILGIGPGMSKSHRMVTYSFGTFAR